MRRVLPFLLLLASFCFWPFAARGQRADSTQRQWQIPDYFEADSIRLRRLRGGWGGPEYEIVIDKENRLSIRPDSIARSLFGTPATTAFKFRDLMALALMSSVARLPDSLEADPVFGHSCATDAPTAVVTLYHRDLVRQVVDYLGCYWAPAGLRDLERAGEEAAGKRPER